MSDSDATAPHLPRLIALETYIRDLDATQTFWRQHFGLVSPADLPASYQIGDIEWRLLGGAEPCGTRGPHGALPVFEIPAFGAARGYLMSRNIPIVFEEILPGMSLLVFLDPDATPIELAQPTDVAGWDIANRRLLRSRRQDEIPTGPLSLGPISELTIYTHDVTASGRFYRDVLGLPVGLSFFAHIHFVAENVPVVLRATSWQCKAPDRPHATEPVFGVSDLAGMSIRLARAGYATSWQSERRLSLADPTGLRLHFEQDSFA